MNQKNENCILVFVKYPELGNIKTRLSADSDVHFAKGLYQSFVYDIINTLESGRYPFHICCYPYDSKDKLKEWLGTHHRYLPQRGDDLGERMKNAFNAAFKADFSRVVLIGSDAPDLPYIFLKEAFASLETNDAVLGPCSDGGYYLIGFNKNAFLQETFDGIKWSTSTVFQNTLSILNNKKLKIHILPQWKDVDTIEDVRALLQRNGNTDFVTSNTVFFLMENKEKIFKYKIF